MGQLHGVDHIQGADPGRPGVGVCVGGCGVGSVEGA